MKKKLTFNYRHIICLAITLGFIACTLFIFPKSIIRIIESVRDLGLSIAYYFLELLEFDHTIVPTVNQMPSYPTSPVIFLPETWEELRIKWYDYWDLFITKNNFNGYIQWLSSKLADISQIIILLMPPIIGIFYLLKRNFEKQNNNYNEDSKPLKVFKTITKHSYVPIKRWIMEFIDFVKNNKVYKKIWLYTWLLNFNVITIIVEFIAYYMYFIITFDFATIYNQMLKLIYDISVPLSFIPVPVWIIVAIIIVKKQARKIALNHLQHMEMTNRGFINERPITVMVCGSMGKGKTTMLVDMALSVEDMFRDKAKNKMLEHEMKFPNFPWIKLETVINLATQKHIIYNIATTKTFINKLKDHFLNSNHIEEEQLAEIYLLTGQNRLFNYDYEKYGNSYDDKLKIIDIWESIETYAQLYFIYTIQSSLMINNFSIRTDSILESIKNFPLWNSDFFTRESALINEISHHAHILDFDSLRLGRKVVSDNEFKDSFEFGVVAITEIGKERQNIVELSGKKKTDETTNQKNDLFNYYLKMIRHSATVDNYPFIKFLTDEQRPESWGADARDLCDIIHIRDRIDNNLTLPFFNVEELLHAWLFNKYTELHYQYRFNRSDNTLTMYLLRSVVSKFHNYYERTYNQFGYSVLNVQTERGTQDGEICDHKYFLMNKKIYSKRFSTDCFSDFFTQKTLRSSIGIDDIPEYTTEKANLDELRSQKSYFIDDINKHFNEQEKDE